MNAPGVPYTHGHYVNNRETSTHAIWRGMLSRCHNPNSKDYKRYGGLGVSVCARWHKFENFLSDMGERPMHLQLDRFPNPHGNYEPGNCRWATRSQNQKNRRNTKRYRYKGRDLTPSELATALGISRALLSYRLKRGQYGNARA